MMNDNKITIEQTVDILIEGARKTSNKIGRASCRERV